MSINTTYYASRKVKINSYMRIRNRPDSHGEGIDVLVKCIQQKDCLDHHVVNTIHIELHLGPAVAMPQAKLGLLQVRILQSPPKTQIKHNRHPNFTINLEIWYTMHKPSRQSFPSIFTQF